MKAWEIGKNIISFKFLVCHKSYHFFSENNCSLVNILRFGNNINVLTAVVFSRAALSGRGWHWFTAICLPFEGSHALLYRAHHVPVEAVAVLARVLCHNIRTVSVEFAAVVASGLGRGGSQGHCVILLLHETRVLDTDHTLGTSIFYKYSRISKTFG